MFSRLRSVQAFPPRFENVGVPSGLHIPHPVNDPSLSLPVMDHFNAGVRMAGMGRSH